MPGKYYYLGKNGLEYANKYDADKYGNGCVGQRFDNPIKQWEPVYENVNTTDPEIETVGVPAEILENEINVPLVDTPQNVTEYDAMDLPQLKKILRDKGYDIKGNLKRETIIEKLKSLQ